ncbi:MAG: NAD(P)/FAD-dependent oxidoreductase [Candidatus Omnitrophica bacterium]|nr:NAD(P)/FAD-dependent oxidoreductase [Candidatus Omnitrophota bacterium]MDD5487760.1 NAD(P)/FAD-dependent oxidoreductase [Candidatus Omnitrophota bacterium]
MKEYDLVIIGGGVSGAAIAREMSKYRLSIALLEKEEELGFGVSKSNSGIIHPGTQNDPSSIKGRLCVRGNRLVRRIARELGVDLKEVGELIVAFNDEEVQRLYALKKEAGSLGVPGLKIVDRKWLAKNEPNLNPDVKKALYAPTAAIISPYRLVYDLAENAARNGVEIFARTCVESIGTTSNGFRVHTTSGEFPARYVVNAAGLYADSIAAMVGIKDISIKPRKGEEFLLDKKRQGITRHLIFPLPTPSSKGVLVIKTADGNPMIGPTADDTEDREDLATTNEGLAKVVDAVRKMVPSIEPDDIIAYFAGVRPVAGKDFIIRHEDSVPGFVNVAGIQSPGLTAAPAIAEMVRDILRSSGLRTRRKLFFHGKRKRTTHLFAIPLRAAAGLIRKDPSYGDIVCRCEMISAREIKDAIARGARTLDGIKFRTRAQAGRCHGSFCTTRIMRILAEATGRKMTDITKRGEGSWIVMKDRADDAT